MKLQAGFPHGWFLQGRQGDGAQRAERRIMHHSPIGNLFAEKGGIVLGRSITDCIIVDVVGLDDNLTGIIAASGTAGRLGDQLECPLRSAKIGKAQHQVRCQNADNRDIREIVAFGDHLRADQRISFMMGELIENPGMSGPPDRRVLVHAQGCPGREFLVEQGLDLLRARAETTDPVAAAGGAGLGRP